MSPRPRLAVALVLLAGATGTVWAQDHDLAAEFSRLQSQVMAAQARLVADMAEARRLRSGPDSGPLFVEDEYCPRPTPPSRMPPWGVEVADNAQTAKARELLDEMLAGIMKANGLSIPGLCPAAIDSKDEFGAWSHESGPLPGSGRRLSVIVVNAGLLSRIDDDSQLAAVLGHELSHLMLLHSRERHARVFASDGIA